MEPRRKKRKADLEVSSTPQEVEEPDLKQLLQRLVSGQEKTEAQLVRVAVALEAVANAAQHARLLHETHFGSLMFQL